MSARVTEHAEDRLGERVGLNKSSVERMANIALEKGISRNDTSGRLRRYLDKLFLSHDKIANNMKIYGQFIYIFNEVTLITVLSLPNEYTKTVNKMRSKE